MPCKRMDEHESKNMRFYTNYSISISTKVDNHSLTRQIITIFIIQILTEKMGYYQKTKLGYKRLVCSVDRREIVCRCCPQISLCMLVPVISQLTSLNGILQCEINLGYQIFTHHCQCCNIQMDLNIQRLQARPEQKLNHIFCNHLFIYLVQ